MHNIIRVYAGSLHRTSTNLRDAESQQGGWQFSPAVTYSHRGG